MNIQNLLFSPITMGGMEVKNRFVMAPMGTKHAGEQGYVTDHIKDYFEARARGGAGLIIVEATLVHPHGRGYEKLLEITNDTFIPGLRELVGVIHRHGAKAAIQLQHCGRLAKSKLTGRQPMAPSAIPASGGETPKELTIEEIKEIIGFFADAAARAKRAGFDGIEIHGAHGYLIDQFLSPSSNKRQDIYGGGVQNRARFLIEILRAVKGAVGDDYPVWCRINGREFGVEDGTTLEEAKETARMAQEAGADAIHVSAYGPQAPQHLPPPSLVSGVLADLAQGIKAAVTVPVILVGRITADAAERILGEGKADLVSIGKAFLADPEIPNKVASGNAEDIRPCILCMACRDDLFAANISVRCQVNPAVGREAEFEISPAKKAKKVLVVGGGPAGMEAARVAALRGHEVTLWEKGSGLGGQLNYAVIPPHKIGIEPLIHYFRAQMERLKVKIELGKAATATMIKEYQPEAVVLATGSVPIIPEECQGKANVVTALEVLGGQKAVRERVAVVGGGMVGCEVAEFLAKRYKDIMILEMLQEMGSDIGPSLRGHILKRLKSTDIKIEVGIEIMEITGAGVRGLRNSQSEFFHAGTVVMAVGMKSERQLVGEIEGIVPEIHLIGDCIEPRRIREAISEGYGAGLRI